MLSTKTSQRNALLNDLTKTATWMVIAHLLTKTRSGGKFFDEESVYAIIFTLLGLVFYHIVFQHVVPPLPTA